MSVKYEQSVIAPADSHISDSIETHPAYAQISAGRVSSSGKGAFLYGSDFGHNHYMTISISRSELHRGLSRDWAHPREEYIEVQLSESQWATFVSTPNSGTGAQCTLNHLMGNAIPQIPETPKRREQFENELGKHFDVALDALKTLSDRIKNLNVSQKKQDELQRIINCAEMNINGNLGFVASQFDEHMEETTEKAKMEVAAYAQNALQRVGITALAETNIPQLNERNEK